MRITKEKAQQILTLIDLTSLSGNESDADIRQLCLNTKNQYGHVAAVCVYPEHVKGAKQILSSSVDANINVATVVNFPSGTDNIDNITKTTAEAITDGANEIDIVLPYQKFLEGDARYCESVLNACRNVCGSQALMKVIIESGELAQANVIRDATCLALFCGADFVKTSTGKVPVNATLEAAELILRTIKENKSESGFKASGGIRTPAEAYRYLDLAEHIMGRNWIKPCNFRFGVSSLLDKLVADIEGQAITNKGDY